MPYKSLADAAARLTKWRAAHPELKRQYVKNWERHNAG